MLNEEKVNYYRNKLLNEKKEIEKLIQVMKNNETIDSKKSISSELSFYDNHPSDIATELSDIEKGAALKNNELNIINKIDKALENIEDGSYGVCAYCGKPIIEERLEFLPYAIYCVKCQDEVHNSQERKSEDRPVEEAVMKKMILFDDNDSYTAIESINKRKNIYEGYEEDDYTDKIEGISNEAYRRTLE